MKYKIIIESEEGETIEDIKNSISGDAWQRMVYEFDQQVLRPITKHGCEDEVRQQAFEDIREKLYQYANEHAVRINP